MRSVRCVLFDGIWWPRQYNWNFISRRNATNKLKYSALSATVNAVKILASLHTLISASYLNKCISMSTIALGMPLFCAFDIAIVGIIAFLSFRKNCYSFLFKYIQLEIENGIIKKRFWLNTWYSHSIHQAPFSIEQRDKSHNFYY